jgi:hypothetical protein
VFLHQNHCEVRILSNSLKEIHSFAPSFNPRRATR